MEKNKAKSSFQKKVSEIEEKGYKGVWLGRNAGEITTGSISVDEIGILKDIPEEYREWWSLLREAIGTKESYSLEEVLRAMYLASSETEWENHPDNPLNEEDQ